jgi:hypothetical protein
VGHTSRSSGLLHVQVSCDRVFQSGLKTGGGVTQTVHMASSWRLRRDQIEDGRIDAMRCVGPCYPHFAVFYVLYIMGILIF